MGKSLLEDWEIQLKYLDMKLGKPFTLVLLWLASAALASAQGGINLRIMAANLNGNTQSYQPFALRILQGTKADVVCIQEFNYSNNADSDFRSLVDTCFGTNFVYYREPYTGGGDIPNGIISRYPIIASGSWADTVQTQPNRGFAWAQIDVPGTNDLYAVSVHLLTSSASNRNLEAGNLKSLIQANFPSNAWVIVAGDFNTDSRTESTMATFDSFLSDNPVPADNAGNSNTSGTRTKPHDYVLPSFSFTNLGTATVFPSHSFPGGLVFDSTVYTPLSDVSPVQISDSTYAQHMAVMKDFLLPVVSVGSNTPPAITSQPSSQTVSPGSNVTFTVSVIGTEPLGYQWLFNGTNRAGATTNRLVLNHAQVTDAGDYSVMITNLYGSATSSVAVLVVSNFPPTIITQPQSQSVPVGASPVFTVTAGGTAPFSYQWLLGGTNLAGGTNSTYSLANVQTNNAGDYSVIVTNLAGSVTSSIATLTVTAAISPPNQAVIAQWNFNSNPPDTNTATGSTAPSIGSGTAVSVGGVSPSFIGGDANLDPAPSSDNSAWTTTGYPAATSNNKTAGVQFNVSTAGKRNIVISWSQRSSNTGGKYFRLQYSTNNGSTFLDYPVAMTIATTFIAFTNSLAGLPGVDNNASLSFRIVSEFESTASGSGSAAYAAAGTSYATTGTSRFDMVTVAGNALMASPAALQQPSLSGGQFGFTVAGDAGLNYIVQTSTNLNADAWLPVLTNASPFSFGDTDIAAPQKFYRAVPGP